MSDIIATTTTNSDSDSLGRLVFWDLNGFVNYEKYCEMLDACGIPNHMHPDFIDPEKALERALNDAIERKQGRGGSNVSVTKMRAAKKGQKVYLVHNKKRNEVEESVDFNEDLKVRLTVLGTVTCEPENHRMAETIKARFNFHCDHLNTSDVGNVNTSVVRWLKGARIRQRGGMYFLAQEHLEQWNSFVAATEEMSEHVFHEIPADNLESVRKAILSGFTSQIESEIAKIESAVEKDLGARGLQTQLRNVAAIQHQMEYYQELMGTVLTELTEKTEELQANVSMLAFAAQAQEKAENEK